MTSIIDWQSVEVAVLFMQVAQPSFLNYDGPRLSGLERPQLPAGFDDLPLEQQTRENAFYDVASLSALYRFWLHVHNPAA